MSLPLIFSVWLQTRAQLVKEFEHSLFKEDKDIKVSNEVKEMHKDASNFLQTPEQVTRYYEIYAHYYTIYRLEGNS